jgi:hypothetical protein
MEQFVDSTSLLEMCNGQNCAGSLNVKKNTCTWTSSLFYRKAIGERCAVGLAVKDAICCVFYEQFHV